MKTQNLLLQLIDPKTLDELLANFTTLTGLNVGVIDTDPNETIMRVGWADICQKFHLANPATEQQCTKDRVSVCSKMTRPGEVSINKCTNGLIYASTPVFIDGQLAAYLFSGQVFCSPPDVSFFIAQAAKYGFDSKDYLDSLDKVKITDENQLKMFLTLLTDNITLLAEKNKQLQATQSELRQQNIIIQKIAEQAPIAIGMANNRKVIWCNQAMSRITGYTEQEILEFDPKLFYLNEEDYLIPHDVENQYKAKGYSERLIKGVKKSGEVMDVLATSAPIDSQTISEKVIFTFMDISEQVRDKALLEESLERLKIISEATKVGFWDWDLKTSQIKTNGPHLQLLGYNTDSQVYTIDQWKEFIHPQDLPWAEEHLKQVVAGQKTTWSVSYRVKAVDGEYRWVRGTGAVLEKDCEGKPLHLVGIHQDITATKQAVIEKAEENQKYREIVLHMSSAVLTLTPAANNRFIIDDFNPAAEAISNIKREDAIGMNYIDRFPGSDGVKVVECMQRVLKTKKPEWLPLDHYQFDSIDIWGEHYIFLLPSKKIALIFNDFTEIKNAELVLQEHHKELEETNITLKVLVRKYEEEKLIQEKRLATNVQMLVNPYLEKIKNTKLTDAQQSYIDIVETGLSDLSSPLATIAAARDFQLSQTETKVANLVRQGHPSKKIADILNISVQTVHKHRATIRKKLGVANQNVNLTTLLNQLD